MNSTGDQENGLQRYAAVGAMLTRQEIVVIDSRVCHQPLEKTLLVRGLGFVGPPSHRLALFGS